MKNSVQPLTGFRDFLPDDWGIQNYIFDTWRKVCERYGYEEYNGPVLESIEIYNKSGDELGMLGKELYSFTDRGERHIALRPEMTPTVGRMVAAYGKQFPKPIRWFSIAQFFRAEKPQRGRGREFFQLNADIFGSNSIYSDVEVINLAIDIMREFGATEEMFRVKVNNRKFTDFYFSGILNIVSDEDRRKLVKLIDAYPKQSDEWLKRELDENGFSEDVYDGIKKYLQLSVDSLKEFSDASEGALELTKVFEMLKLLGVDQFCEVDTSIARGFDYYTGMVFEVFDNSPTNNRSMFGGGRYDDLVDMFGENHIPAVGFAPGDITTRLFLESWGLLDTSKINYKESYYIPVLNDSDYDLYQSIAKKIRSENCSVEVGLSESTISDALRYANRKKYKYVIIIGEDEKEGSVYKLKDMDTGEEKMISFK